MWTTHSPVACACVCVSFNCCCCCCLGLCLLCRCRCVPAAAGDRCVGGDEQGHVCGPVRNEAGTGEARRRCGKLDCATSFALTPSAENVASTRVTCLCARVWTCVCCAQEAVRQSMTRRGRFFNMLGYFLSVYCLYKMVMATVNIIFDRDPTKDPVTRGFEVGCRTCGQWGRAGWWLGLLGGHLVVGG